MGNEQSENGPKKDAAEGRIAQLEKELLRAREDMRSITEDQEAANEELQSANEELLSGSEELQSLNEELETGKEELQSTNEELITVNQELFDRNELYNHARLYAEAIVTTIHEPLLVLAKDFRVKSANASFYKIFQLTEDKTLGKVLFELQNNGWDIPDLRTQLLKIQTQKEMLLEWKLTYTFPVAGKRIIQFNAQPVQKENDESWILLAMDDITERATYQEKLRESEARFHQMADLMPTKITTANPDGGVTYYNKAWLDYAGMSMEELQDFGYHKIMHPDELEEFQKRLQQAGKNGTVMEMEMRFMDKNGNYRWHLNRALPVMDSDGNQKMWIGATTDIQDQKRKEEEKTEFINIASHELKTPLTTTKLYIHLLKGNLSEEGLLKNNNPEQNLFFVQKAEQSVERLQLLIEELLDVDKIKLGKLDLNITAFNFNEMLDNAIEDVQSSTYNHTFIKKGLISLPFKGDKDRLQQVIINLLTNAAKYSPESGKVFITVTEDEEMIKVAVKDQGVGIKKENLKKIFDLYFREESAHPFQGFGIGLSIANEIVHRHNGKIWAESEPGNGTTVYFTIPR